MTPVVTAVVTAVGVILAGVVVALVKNSRSSPETRTALDAGWDKLTGGLERRLVSLEASDVRKDEQIGQATARVAEVELQLEAMAVTLRKVQALNQWLTNRVAQLIAFIVTHDLTPPDEEPQP